MDDIENRGNPVVLVVRSSEIDSTRYVFRWIGKVPYLDHTIHAPPGEIINSGTRATLLIASGCGVWLCDVRWVERNKCIF